MHRNHLNGSERQNGLELKLPPLVLVVIVAALMWVAAYATPMLDFSLPAKYLWSWSLALIGVLVCLSGVVSFRRAKTTVNPTKPDSTSSLGIHPNYFDAQLKMLQRLGMKWSRVSSPSPFCRWSYIEPAEGVFTFYDAQVLLANTYGLSSMCTIGTNNYWPSWAADPSNNGLPDLTKWQTFVTQLVTPFAIRVTNRQAHRGPSLFRDSLVVRLGLKATLNLYVKGDS